MKRGTFAALFVVLLTGCGKDNPVSSVPSMVTDIDGNVYHTVIIGTQVWMVENLVTTKFNDGTAIPLVTGDTSWGNLTTPGYCWYDNDSANKNLYGALYNWHTVNSGKLAPPGWHVPTDAEWSTLIKYLGGYGVAGGKMKEAGTGHWKDPNYGADNSSRFTALPGGCRVYDGAYISIEGGGYWWSSTESPPVVSFYYLYHFFEEISRATTVKCSGYSVRCVRDHNYWLTGLER